MISIDLFFQIPAKFECFLSDYERDFIKKWQNLFFKLIYKKLEFLTKRGKNIKINGKFNPGNDKFIDFQKKMHFKMSNSLDKLKTSFQKSSFFKTFKKFF